MKNRGKHNKKNTFTKKDICIIRMQIFDIQHTQQNEINSSTFFRNCSSSTFLLQLQITPLKTYPDKYLSL